MIPNVRAGQTTPRSPARGRRGTPRASAGPVGRPPAAGHVAGAAGARLGPMARRRGSVRVADRARGVVRVEQLAADHVLPRADVPSRHRRDHLLPRGAGMAPGRRPLVGRRQGVGDDVPLRRHPRHDDPVRAVHAPRRAGVHGRRGRGERAGRGLCRVAPPARLVLAAVPAAGRGRVRRQPAGGPARLAARRLGSGVGAGDDAQGLRLRPAGRRGALAARRAGGCGQRRHDRPRAGPVAVVDRERRRDRRAPAAGVVRGVLRLWALAAVRRARRRVAPAGDPRPARRGLARGARALARVAVPLPDDGDADDDAPAGRAPCLPDVRPARAGHPRRRGDPARRPVARSVGAAPAEAGAAASRGPAPCAGRRIARPASPARPPARRAAGPPTRRRRGGRSPAAARATGRTASTPSPRRRPRPGSRRGRPDRAGP